MSPIKLVSMTTYQLGLCLVLRKLSLKRTGNDHEVEKLSKKMQTCLDVAMGNDHGNSLKNTIHPRGKTVGKRMTTTKSTK